VFEHLKSNDGAVGYGGFIILIILERRSGTLKSIQLWLTSAPFVVKKLIVPHEESWVIQCSAFRTIKTFLKFLSSVT